MSFHVINLGESPFVVDGDKLQVSSGQRFDYEALVPEKKLLVTVNSRGSKSGVFTKQFVIEIIGKMRFRISMLSLSRYANGASRKHFNYQH